MSTQSLPTSDRGRATSGEAVAALSMALAADPKLAIKDLIQSMEGEIEEYTAEHIR
jgi:hypothetical protein